MGMEEQEGEKERRGEGNERHKCGLGFCWHTAEPGTDFSTKRPGEQATPAGPEEFRGIFAYVLSKHLRQYSKGVLIFPKPGK